jgi:hypothetical protein
MQPDGTLAPVQEGSGDRHVNVSLFMPADMAGHIALEGQGGTRDKKKHFCTHCYCHSKHRHMPFQLIRVQTNTSVGQLASEHDTPVSLLWAVNTGHDFDGMFNTLELSEQVLGDITLPLADEPSSEAAAVDPVMADEPSSEAVAVDPVMAPAGKKRAPKAGTGQQMPLNSNDLAFSRSSRPTKQRKAGQPAQKIADARPGRIASSHVSLRKETAQPENIAAAEMVVVPAGAVVRVVQTHKMERRSQFVDQYLQLDRER